MRVYNVFDFPLSSKIFGMKDETNSHARHKLHSSGVNGLKVFRIKLMTMKCCLNVKSDLRSDHLIVFQ